MNATFATTYTHINTPPAGQVVIFYDTDTNTFRAKKSDGTTIAV